MKTITLRKGLLIALGCMVWSAAYADTLNVPLCPQQKSQWCWAASSQALLLYYGTNVRQTQCVQVVSDSTTNNPAPMTYIRDILTHFNCSNVYTSSGTLNDAACKTEINNKHPFCIFWHWSSGGGHFVDVAGYTGTTTATYKIMNPWAPNVGAWNYGTWNYLNTAQNSGNWSGYIVTTKVVSGILSGSPRNPVAANSLTVSPNPVNKNRGAVQFNFAVSDLSDASIEVFDVSGSAVFEQKLASGTKAAVWNFANRNAARIASGKYFSVLKYRDSRNSVKKIQQSFVIY